MRVECEVEEIEMEGDHGGTVPGVCVTCGRCRHQVEVFGTSDRSVRRGLVMLREECPEERTDIFYVSDEDYEP